MATCCTTVGAAVVAAQASMQPMIAVITGHPQEPALNAVKGVPLPLLCGGLRRG